MLRSVCLMGLDQEGWGEVILNKNMSGQSTFHENDRSIPMPPLPLHARSLALSSACSSGEGSTGGGPGYPFGKRVRLAVLMAVRMRAGERKSDNRWGRSLSRKGIMDVAIIDKVVKKMLDEKRSREQLISEIMARGA